MKTKAVRLQNGAKKLTLVGNVLIQELDYIGETYTFSINRQSGEVLNCIKCNADVWGDASEVTPIQILEGTLAEGAYSEIMASMINNDITDEELLRKIRG